MKIKQEGWSYTDKRGKNNNNNNKHISLVLIQLNEIQLAVFGMVPKM